MFENYQKHVAYNLVTGDILTTNSGNQLKRWVARHTSADNKWAKACGLAPIPHKWVFAHGSSCDDCIAKLRARRVWG